MNDKLDALLTLLSHQEEIKKANELAIKLKSKYGDIFEIDKHKDDPLVSNYIDYLEEISNVANLISVAFLNELKI